MKKILIYLFLFIFLLKLSSFDLTKFPADQQIIITAYALVLDEKEPDTMDSINQKETDELVKILAMNGTDFEMILDDLQSKVKLTVYPESIYVRYEMIRDYKVKLDVNKINSLVDLFKKKGLNVTDTRKIVNGIISNLCKGVNSSSKYAKYQESIDNLIILTKKLIDSNDILNTLLTALSNETIKNYILKN